MRTFRIGFSRPIVPTLFSKAIMWTDGTQYDHVYVRWTWNGINRDIIYQASKLAVNFESDITFNTHATVVEEYEVQLDDPTFMKVMQFCMDNSDKPYSLKEIVGFVWVQLNKLIGKKVDNPFPGHGSEYVCSTLASSILIIAGIMTTNQPVENIDPLDLNNIIKSIPAIKRVI